MIKISAVILTFNSVRSIGPCLDSLFRQSAGPVQEAIVVDNGSTDGTVEFIRKNYPRVILIGNKANLGSCAARNQGIAAAKADWVLTLDCDVVLAGDFLERIEESAARAPANTGMIAAKILMPDERTVYSCGIYLTWFRKFYDLGKGKSAGYDKDRKAFGPCSAAALYKKEMLDQIKEDTGYFDERFFFLVEDVDLAWRAERRGWQAWFSSGARCYHAGDSSATGRKDRQLLCLRNRFYMIIKNEGILRYVCRVLPVIFYDLPRFLAVISAKRHKISPGSATRSGLPQAGKK